MNIEIELDEIYYKTFVRLKFGIRLKFLSMADWYIHDYCPKLFLQTEPFSKSYRELRRKSRRKRRIKKIVTQFRMMILVLFLLLSHQLPFLNTLKCYECDSTSQIECADGRVIAAYKNNRPQINVVNCNNYCSKDVTYHPDGSFHFKRHCSESCVERSGTTLGKSQEFFCCTSSYCNHSSINSPTIKFLVMLQNYCGLQRYLEMDDL
ncbi:hypothetical protein SNEBB_002119 [Seison nebaliae]|nr:hypothetical protein SNEBB_002119 [Seison nebaliae]